MKNVLIIDDDVKSSLKYKNWLEREEGFNSTLIFSSSAFTVLSPWPQSNKKLFTNSLISESDLLTGNYDPEIINNIDRLHPNKDRCLWYYNCTMTDENG